MKNANSVEARNGITNLSFAFGYFHRYRYTRSQILEKDVETALLLPPSWYLAYIETMEIAFKMFSKVIEPTWKLVADAMKVDLKDKRFKKTFVSKEPVDKTRLHKFSFITSFPWKIWDAKDTNHSIRLEWR